ncbi:hypothetical protein COCVIDRAFT_40224 [Bipolaris victoriae FI3]|uniref:Uncharacterized protein n=1 Tax=Bipolaris victoriae (strain FI3) TaxID=930091 RepID=W7EB21_BIPV3|nr:hypothetical protein COCVIDRAFT_40224 [Bipolaris victoriae FI3]
MTRNVPTLPRMWTNRVSRRRTSTTARSCHAMSLHGRQIAKCAALPWSACMKSGNFNGPRPRRTLIHVEAGLPGIRVLTARY